MKIKQTRLLRAAFLALKESRSSIVLPLGVGSKVKSLKLSMLRDWARFTRTTRRLRQCCYSLCDTMRHRHSVSDLKTYFVTWASLVAKDRRVISSVKNGSRRRDNDCMRAPLLFWRQQVQCTRALRSVTALRSSIVMEKSGQLY